MYSCSEALITKAFAEIPGMLNTCSRCFLLDLPVSVRAVLLLENTDTYVKRCRSLLKSLFPTSFSAVNAMAVDAGSTRWVHLAHPSRLNGHFNTWLHSEQGPGEKWKLARAAIAGVESVDLENPDSLRR